jgi:hypothetical protein
MLRPGYHTHRKATTGDAPYTERLLEEGQLSLVEAIGADRNELRKMIDLGRIARVDYPLASRHNPAAESDDRLTIVWHEDGPAIVVVESRDEYNFIDTNFGYFGPRR